MTDSTTQILAKSAALWHCLARPPSCPSRVARPCRLTYLVHPPPYLARLPRLTLIRPPCMLATSRVLCISPTFRPPCILAASSRHLAHLVHPPPRASSASPFTLYSRRLVFPPCPLCAPAASCVLMLPSRPPRLRCHQSLFFIQHVWCWLGGIFFCTCCNCCITYATNELSSSAKM